MKVNETMQFAPTKDTDHSALVWLERERKIPVDVAAKFGVSSVQGRLAFEFSRNGELQYRKVRIDQEDGGKSFRRDRSDVPSCMFNEDCLLDQCGPDDVLIITEGEIDCLSFLTIGCPFVVSVPDGAQLAKPGEGDIVPTDDKAFVWLWADGKLRAEIAKFGKILLATDDDEKGRILRDELAVRIGRHKCWYLRYPEGCKDANEVLVKYDPDSLIDAFAAMEPIVASRLVPFSSIPETGYRDAYKSGWSDLDEHLRLVPPELVVVTGKPGSGKSQWTLAWVANLARNYGLKGAILQFEDNVERNRLDLMRYALNRHVPERPVFPGDPQQDSDAKLWMDRFFITISPSEDVDSSVDYTLLWLQEAVEEAATRHGCKWILIDPWNEVEHIWSRSENEAKYTNDALRGLKRLARRYQIAIIVVTHPSKEGGKLKEIEDMSLYDIAGAAAWKNKADHGIIIHRNEEKKFTWVKIDKSKNHAVMGTPGIVKMRFSVARGTYEFVEKGA